MILCTLESMDPKSSGHRIVGEGDAVEEGVDVSDGDADMLLELEVDGVELCVGVWLGLGVCDGVRLWLGVHVSDEVGEGEEVDDGVWLGELVSDGEGV